MDIPPGAMLEVNLDLIAEGRLVKQINAAIREAHAALERRKADGVTTGSCTITASISVGYDPDMRDTIAITHCVTLKTPKNEETSLAKEKNGVLLCQPTGADNDNPDQQRLFDANGRPLGTIDRRTGEVIEPKQDQLIGRPDAEEQGVEHGSEVTHSPGGKPLGGYSRGATSAARWVHRGRVK